LSVGAIPYAVCAAAYLGLTLLLLVNWRRTVPGVLLVAAGAITALWAAAAGLATYGVPGWAAAASPLELARNAAWFAFVLSVLAAHREPDRRTPRALVAMAAVAVGLVASAAAVEAIDLVAGGQALTGGTNLRYVTGLLLAIGGLMLLENLYRNADPQERWALKFLVVGLGGLFAFDAFIYADAILFNRWNSGFNAARGLIDAMMVPLIAISAARSRRWAPAVHVSRQIVFHSATILVSGLFLLVMSAAGFYVRTLGGGWGLVIQTTLVFAALVLAVVFVLSGQVRAAAKLFVSKHFYSYRYDYREEWLRFIGKLADEDDRPLGERMVRAVADVFDVPAGTLWLRTEAGFAGRVGWNLAPPLAYLADDDPFIEALERDARIVSVDRPEDAGVPPPPEVLTPTARPWLVVPLVHHDELVGIMVLARPRVPRTMAEEDLALLRILSRQAASYMAEWLALEALTEARRFEEFNQRVTFIVHDLKNIAGQLSLLAGNAPKFRTNPEFIDDMIATVAHSVTALNRLLAHLNAERGRDTEEPKTVRLHPVVDEVVRQVGRAAPVPAVDCRDEAVAVTAPPAGLAAVLRNLIRNAAEAAGAEGHVTVRLARADGEAVIEIEDDGPGMDPGFVHNELFRPFRSSKGGGYGIGAFESRQFARRAGGRLDVRTAPGRGTVMRLILPAAPADSDTPSLVKTTT
jgi:putative PEP-CTERM system histidine kinase